ncbi:MAG TPA: glycosyltransferase, partial [Solirubrobacterales bacterium]|nr:glycosyltransferase [Solirubrobacterales bacterium]
MGLGSAGPQGSTANGTQAEERANGSLRVLAVGTLYPPRSLGDYERVWKDAVVKLRDGGHQVKVLCSDWAGNDTGEDEDPDIRRDLRLYVDDVLDVRSEERAELVAREVHNRQIVDEVLAEFRPDVALLGPGFGLPLSVVTRIQEAGVAQVAFVADDWPKDAPKADPGQQLLGWTARLFGRPAREGVEGRRFRYADVDQWVCASERAADVVRRAGADPHTLTVLRPGPDPRRFRRRDAKPLRGELLYAGLLHPKKGVEHAVRALAAAEKFKLTIAGPGDPRHVEKLREIAAEEGVQDRVRMLGEQYKRMPELYAESDAVLFPSVWREAWTLGPLEAMAVGRPVITTAVGGMAEYLRHEENALVVRPADPGAIAAAVDRLAKDDVLHARLIQGGFATADEYRYDRFLDRLAGTVVALGESPGERDEEESVTEPQQHEPVPQPEPEETPDRQPAQETPVGAPEAVGTIATPRRRFAGVQGQAIGGRPEPAATATEAPPKEEAKKVEPEPVAEAPAPEQTAEPPKPEPTATQPAPAPPQPEPVVEEAMPEPEQPTPPAPEPQPVAAPPKPEPVAEQPKPEPVAAPPKPEAPAPAPAAETPAATPPIPEVAADDENV